MTPWPESAVPLPEPQVGGELVDGEVLLYHPGTATAVYLNETAALVWRLCDGERTVGQIASLLAGAFPESASTVAKDVTTSLRALESRGIVRFA